MTDETIIRGTPNFIRTHCAERFLAALPVLEEIIHGGIQVDEQAAEILTERKQTVVAGRLMATIDQRLSAIKLYAQCGVGYRSDHTTGDEPIRRGVVAMPPWDSEKHAIEVPVRAHLPPMTGNGSGNGVGKSDT